MTKDWYNIEIIEDRESTIRRAKDCHMAIVEPEDNQLQIDIDSEDDMDRFDKFYSLLSKELPGATYNLTTSISGYPHYHITVTCVEAMDVWKRIALQACLGSHINREVLNAYRVMRGSDLPIAFF